MLESKGFYVTVDSSKKNSENYIPHKLWTKKYFRKGNVLIFIGACGIAVRSVAPFMKNKRKDAAVLVCDEHGKNVVSLLSGHIGHGNEACNILSSLIGANPVITTSSDVNKVFALDVFAEKNSLSVSDFQKLKIFSSRFLEEKKCLMHVDESICENISIKNKPEYVVVENCADGNYDNIFTLSYYAKETRCLKLIPRCIVIGVGCRKGKSFFCINRFIRKIMKENDISEKSVHSVASIDLKKNENGIKKFAKRLGVPFVTFSAEELNSFEGDFKSSDFVRKITGTDNVCERSVIACGAENFIIHKQSFKGITVAIGIRNTELTF